MWLVNKGRKTDSAGDFLYPVAIYEVIFRESYCEMKKRDLQSPQSKFTNGEVFFRDSLSDDFWFRVADIKVEDHFYDNPMRFTCTDFAQTSLTDMVALYVKIGTGVSLSPLEGDWGSFIRDTILANLYVYASNMSWSYRRDFMKILGDPIFGSLNMKALKEAWFQANRAISEADYR